MWKKLLVFSLAFCLSLILLQFFKSKVETNSAQFISSPTISNNSSPTQSNWTTSINSSSAFKDLIKKLQYAVAEDDKITVVSLINFPVKVESVDKKGRNYLKEVKSESEFLSNYDKIFDNSFKKSISQINSDKLLYSSSGEVFTPNFEVRMDRIYKNSDTNFEIKIIKLFK